MKRQYLIRVIISIDMFLNVLLLNGYYGQTISGQIGYESLNGALKWRVAQALINMLFCLEDNHCYNSIRWNNLK